MPVQERQDFVETSLNDTDFLLNGIAQRHLSCNDLTPNLVPELGPGKAFRQKVECIRMSDGAVEVTEYRKGSCWSRIRFLRKQHEFLKPLVGMAPSPWEQSRLGTTFPCNAQI